MKNVFSVNSAQLRYEILRNITSDQQKKSNVSYFVGVIKSDQLIDLPDEENVRRFLGNQAKATGKVQQAILNTLKDRPEEFSLLNGGITLVAHSAKIDSDSKQILLTKPSIINGSQTRGVLKVYHEESSDNPAIDVKFELIISTDDDQIADVSISRNYQTKVKDVSIAGRKGAFEPLNKALKENNYPYRLNEDESQKDGIEPTLAIQLAFLLMPKTMWESSFPKVKYAKAGLYSSSAKWLNLYADIFDKAERGDKNAEAIMEYFIDIVPLSLDLYRLWKTSDHFVGHKISNGITRDENGEITDIKNGWLFPIISAHSVWVKQNKQSSYEIIIPDNFNPSLLIEVVKEAYKVKHDVNALGKNSMAYSMTELTASNM